VTAIRISTTMRIAILVACLIACAMAPFALLAQKDASPLPGIDIAQQRSALLQARAQAEEARKRSEALEAKSRESANAADRTKDQIAAVAARIQQREAELQAAQARIAIIAEQQREQARRLATRQQPIVRLTAALQQLAQRSPVLSLVAPGTVSEAVHRRIVLAQVMPAVTDSTRELRQTITRTADLRRSAEAASQSLASTRESLATQRQSLATLEQKQRLTSRNLRANASAETERALAMGEQVRDIGELMKRVEDAASVRDALLQLPGPTLRPSRPDAAPPPPAGLSLAPAGVSPPPSYRLPAIGAVVTGFGEVSPGGIRSRGITIATPANATVVAPANGKVAFAGPFRGYGSIVIIEHGGSWTSLLANLAKLSVEAGDRVRQGDPVGSTSANQARLTLELRRQDEPVDIAALLR
jgi:septal ring factor EnvC (AmiA/AmiB activator)